MLSWWLEVSSWLLLFINIPIVGIFLLSQTWYIFLDVVFVPWPGYYPWPCVFALNMFIQMPSATCVWGQVAGRSNVFHLGRKKILLAKKPRLNKTLTWRYKPSYPADIYTWKSINSFWANCSNLSLPLKMYVAGGGRLCGHHNVILFPTQVDGFRKFEEDSTWTFKQAEEGRKSFKPSAATQAPIGATKCQSKTLWPCLRNTLYPLLEPCELLPW